VVGTSAMMTAFATILLTDKMHPFAWPMDFKPTLAQRECSGYRSL
jgi:hypothetical protein